MLVILLLFCHSYHFIYVLRIYYIWYLALSARMERWELEGKPTYKNPQNTDNRGFKRPSNNVPQALPREKRNKDRDEQRIQTPLQNNLVAHEEGE
jgi:hypothetical protein